MHNTPDGIRSSGLAETLPGGIRSGTLVETLPEDVLEKYNLARRKFSINNIHNPESFMSLQFARRRLVFEELFYMSLGLMKLRSRRTVQRGRVFTIPDFAEFFDILQYEPTSAQRRAIGEGASDMASGALVSRLVQGDVGSGKTLVAAALAWMAAKNGSQTAFMAPTEILAAQHFDSLSKLFAPLGVTCALLTGGLPAAEKREARAAASSGAASIVIGTHALLSDPVAFASLGLVICDEQHRFGVNQRYALAAKGEHPHVIVMSATPIPRTLGLILYGDLDLSIIDEMPPGRQKIDTFRVGEDIRPRIEAFVRKQVGEGRQAYIICPLVEDSDDGELDGEDEAGAGERGAGGAGGAGGKFGGKPPSLEGGGAKHRGLQPVGASLKSVTAHAEDLKNRVYKDLRVGLIHGRMKSSEKDHVMSEFAAGMFDILVSTTVVEVGVDNPNASLMIVENADRFGLSQLHQLRGRVGRGPHKSYCILFCEDGNASAVDRMDILCKTNDGFKIAEKDLELRGPGEFFGIRQHGLPGLRLANLVSDMGVLKEAQEAASYILKIDGRLVQLEHREVAKKLLSLFGETAIRY